jgi:hypothetical protein
LTGNGVLTGKGLLTGDGRLTGDGVLPERRADANGHERAIARRRNPARGPRPVPWASGAGRARRIRPSGMVIRPDRDRIRRCRRDRRRTLMP